MALKTAEKMFYAETPFDAEDLVEVSTIIFKHFRSHYIKGNLT